MVKDFYKFTVLGCGSSAGVPRPNGDWGSCDPKNSKNFRSRASLLVERKSKNGATVAVIDTGPDFRTQMLASNVHHLDGTVYTHAHADHIHGIDDLRSFVMRDRQLMDVYANKVTLERLKQAFGYCFKTPTGSSYPPILKAHEISEYQFFDIEGEGGKIRFFPITQIHGDITSLGFRIGNVAYCTDLNEMPEASINHLFDLEVLIIDALQYKPHPSHFSLNEALQLGERLKPKRTILTHMHIAMDYQTLQNETPLRVEPAYDGLTFTIEI